MIRLITRRQFMINVSRFAALFGMSGLLPRVLHAAGAGAPPMLAPVIREMFPHPSMDDAFYNRAASAIWERAAATAGMHAKIRDGLARLESGGWQHAGSDERPGLLTGLEREPFFEFLRATSITVIYRDPQLWKAVGYGGNALARGGYLGRFNDIDWLP